jgi:membrane-associated phospholipid phosphatase
MQPRIFATLLGFLGLLTGCSTAFPQAPVVPTNGPSGSIQSAADAIETVSPQYASESPRNDGFGLSYPSFTEPVAWQLAAAGSTSQTSTAPSYETENLFSIDYVKRVGRDIKHTFTAPARWDTTDWLVAGGVAAGVGAAFAFDTQIQKAVQRNRNATVDSIFRNIEPFGGEYSVGMLAAFYLGGELFHDARAKAVALDGISASIITSALIVQPLKVVVGRNRPLAGHGDSRFRPFGGSYSFPSGHATQAFAVATVIAEHYDSPWIKIASYTLASAVGFARINDNNHWTTDILAGAAIGIFVGEVVVHSHRDFSISPMVSRERTGLQLTWAY